MKPEPKAKAKLRSKRVRVAIGVTAMLAGCAGATQWVAYCYDWSLPGGHRLAPLWRHLLTSGAVLSVCGGLWCLSRSRFRRYGLPLVTVGACLGALSIGRLYSPHYAAEWWLRARFNDWVLRQAGIGFATGFAMIALGFAPLAWRPKPKRTTSSGSAKWNDQAKIHAPKAKEPGRSELLIGRSSDTGRLLSYGGMQHLFTVAGTRGGKGNSAIIPNYLSYGGGIVGYDPKAENWLITRRWRTRVLGQECAGLDPFDIAEGANARFNPLDRLDPASKDWQDDAFVIADTLVEGDSGDGSGDHWNRAAKGTLLGFILYVTKKFDVGDSRRSLPEVRRVVTASEEDFQEVLREMKRMGGLVASAAHSHTKRAEREARSVISSTEAHTRWLDSKRMQDVLSETTFDLSGLKRGELSLYIILPPKRRFTHRPWVRLMMGSALFSQMNRKPYENRVLFMIDEASQLGHMPLIEDAYGIAAGYGITLWLFFQNIGQAKSRYKDSWQTFIGNAGVRQFFRNGDPETQKLVTEMAGKRTIFKKSESANAQYRELEKNRSHGSNLSEAGRDLVMPSEVGRLEKWTEQILLLSSEQPFKTHMINYEADPEFKGRFETNPLNN